MVKGSETSIAFEWVWQEWWHLRFLWEVFKRKIETSIHRWAWPVQHQGCLNGAWPSDNGCVLGGADEFLAWCFWPGRLISLFERTCRTCAANREIVLDCCCWCLFMIWYYYDLYVDRTWICFHVSIVQLLFCSWIHPEATYGQKWTWKLVDDRIRSLWGVTGRFGRNATWPLRRWPSLTVPRAALPGLDACDVAKEPVVFYGAGPARFFFLIPSCRTHWIDVTAVLVKFACCYHVASRCFYHCSITIDICRASWHVRIEATSGSIMETKTFMISSPGLGLKSFHISHQISPQMYLCTNLRPTKKRFNFSFFPTGSTDPLNRQLWCYGLLYAVHR